MKKSINRVTRIFFKYFFKTFRFTTFRFKRFTMELSKDPSVTGVAEKLYTELPETSFTRSISNPEAVMRRRRQMKLEKKLQQIRSKDGGPDSGVYDVIES